MNSARAARCLAPLLAAALLSGCNAWSRLSQLGETPPLTTIQDPRQQPGYKPVSLPMPAPMVAERRPSSLWQTGSRAFFKDQRASQPGDILTVVVSFNDQAQFNNNTQGQRYTQEQDGADIFGLKWLFGLGAAAGANAYNNLFNINGVTNNQTISQIQRQEQVTFNVAAMVTQVLPNGDLVVVGHQEMRVNHDIRDLQVTGVVRPLDISAVNTVSLDKLAEARVSYGGRGWIDNMQQPRYGEQLIDIAAPF